MGYNSIVINELEQRKYFNMFPI